MTQGITILTGLVALTMLFGIGVLIFYYKWEGFMKKVLQANKEARAERGYEDETVTAVPEKPLLKRFFDSGGIITVILVVLFPVLYLLIQALLSMGSADNMKGGIAGFMLVLFILFTIVVGVLGLYEKHPNRKFWMELFPTIALEALLAMMLFMMLEADYGYGRDGRMISNTMNLLVILLPALFAYAEKSRRNWKRMLLPDETEQTEKTE